MLSTQGAEVLPSTSLLAMNENVSAGKMGRDAVGSKTPVSNKTPRRALGDISNRKNPYGNGSVPTKLVSFKGVATPAPVQPSKTPRLKATTTATKVPSGVSNSRQRSEQKSSRCVKFSIPHEESGEKSAVETMKKTSTQIAPPIDDIERPAGRLYKQEQLLYGDDDFDFNPSSFVPRINVMSRQDILQCMSDAHRRNLEYEDEELEKCCLAWENSLMDQVRESDEVLRPGDLSGDLFALRLDDVLDDFLDESDFSLYDLRNDIEISF